jgi:hypothetical protein
MARIEFNEWLPDQPGVIGKMKEALNVVPQAVGYGPFPSVSPYSNDADEPLIAVAAAKNPSTGGTEVFAGSTGKLYKLDAVTLDLDDVSKSGGYTTPTSERWRFLQFGSTFLAANGDEKIQSWQLGASTTWADVDSAAPTAKYITAVRDFVVTANTGTSERNKVQWSGINDETDWTPSATNQSDFQIIPDGGEIRGITGGEFGLVLMERSIVRMSYAGTPLIFQFDNIARNLGCLEPNSVTQYQGITYWLGEDGFYACDGQQVIPIGSEKVDRYFFENVDEAFISRMSATFDPIRNLIIWAYPSNAGSGAVDSLIIYNFATRNWSRAQANISYVGQSATPSYTLEALDAFGTLDTLDTSLDSIVWLGGKANVVGVQDSKIITFTGPSMSATLNTGDLEVGERQSIVNMTRPLVDRGEASVAVATRSRLVDAVSFTSFIPADAEGRAALRSIGKYHRFSVRPSGTWRTAIGLEVNIVPLGGR